MTGRTNTSAGGKTELELIWTNPNPGQNFSSPFSLTTNDDCMGFVIDAKRMATDPDTTWARNFISVGTTNQRLLGLTGIDFVFSNRLATAQARTITITVVDASVPNRTIPLRIYAIKA